MKQLLQDKPSDPVPYIYSFLKQKSEGAENPVTPSNREVAEAKNLRKKHEHLKSLLGQCDGSDETEESEQDDSEEEEVKKPVKPRK